MPPPTKVTECHVTVSPDLAVGTFANAFRVIHDVGAEYFLDFLVYSATDGQAKVVSRVRVHEHFLGLIHERMGAVVQGVLDAQLVRAHGPKEDMN